MGKGCASSGSYSGARGSYTVDGRSAYMTAMALSRGSGFYGGISGLYEPTDGNMFAHPRMHGGMEFNPVSRYEGKGEGPTAFNAGTTYRRGPSIDNKLSGNDVKTGASHPQEPTYFSTTNFMQYIQ